MPRLFDLKFPKCSIRRNCPRRALYKGGCKDHCPDVVDGDKEIGRLCEELEGVKGELNVVSAQRRGVDGARCKVDDVLCRRVPTYRPMGRADGRASARPCLGILMKVFLPEAPHHDAVAVCEKPVYEACTRRTFDADLRRDWRTLKDDDIDDVDNILGRAEAELRDLKGRLEVCLRAFEGRVALTEARVDAAREKLRVAEDAQRRRKERWEHVDLNYLPAATKHAYNVIMRNFFLPGGWYTGFLERKSAARRAEIDAIKGASIVDLDQIVRL